MSPEPGTASGIAAAEDAVAAAGAAETPLGCETLLVATGADAVGERVPGLVNKLRAARP